MFVARLLSVAVKLGLVAVVIVGGVYVYQNWKSWTADDSGSGPAPIDYNCGLPGCGHPWLTGVSADCDVHGHGVAPPFPPDPAADERGVIDCQPGKWRIPYPGWFWVEPGYDMLYVPIDDRDEGGWTLNWREVYAAVCAVHPQLGGSGLTEMSSDDRAAYGLSGDRWYAGSGTAANGKDNIYLLPVLSTGTLDYMTGDGTGACGSSQVTTTPAATRRESPTSAPKATPTPTPTASPETRRYRITVNGYENVLRWFDGERLGVRFDYRLIGEFVLERATPSKPWTVASRRVVTAELKYSSLYPADRYQVTLNCVRRTRSCEGDLIRSTTLRLRVRLDGDEIIARWGGFRPEVLVTGSGGTDSSDTYISEWFDDAIDEQRLPLQDPYVGPQRIGTYPGRSDIMTSFAYGLERLP